MTHVARGLAALVALSWLSGCLDFDLAYDAYCATHACDGGGGSGGAGGGGGGSGGSGGSGGGAGGGSGGSGGGSGGGAGGGGGSGGGAGGGSGGGAGGGSGGGAGGGGGGGGVYDGGAPCLASDRPRLQCAPPIDLGLDGGAHYGWLSTNDDGLLLAQIRPAVPMVELRQLLRDGGQTYNSWNTTGAATTISVHGTGNRWALTWIAPVGASTSGVSCVTSAAPGTVFTVDAGVDGDEVSVAVTGVGGVGVAMRHTNGGLGRMGASAGGCPTSYVEMRQQGSLPLGLSGVAATVLPGLTTVYDFRFAGVEYDGLGGGAHATFGFLPDGGVGQAVRLNNNDPGFDVSGAMANDGQNLLISYVGGATDGGYSLNVKALPTNLTSPSAIGREVMPDVRFWGSNLCGASAYVTTGVLRNAPVSLRASFVSADAVYADLAGGSWDIACQRSSSPRNAAPAVIGSKLYVLYTDPARNELHVCDLPPGL